MNVEHLRNLVRTGLADDQCALCGTPISTWLSEIACPHWFLTHGKVGLHPAKLAAVFESFEPGLVIDYLRALTDENAKPGGRNACREWQDETGRHVRIDWRLRTWQFTIDNRAGREDTPIRDFVLRTFYRGAPVAEGRIALLDRVPRVRFSAVVDPG